MWDMLGLPEWVAATRRGLTPWPAAGYPGVIWLGVVVPPVETGVAKFEGISDVNMLAEGERMNFCVMVPSRDCVKPIQLATERISWKVRTPTFYFTTVANHNQRIPKLTALRCVRN